MFTLILSLCAVAFGSPSFTFPSHFTAGVQVTATGTGDLLPHYLTRGGAASSTISGTISFDSDAVQGYRIDRNDSAVFPDTPAWASSLISLDATSDLAFLNVSSGQCAYSCKGGNCCTTSQGLRRADRGVQLGNTPPPAPPACACSSVDVLALAQVAFSSAVQESTGCSSLGVSGTLFKYEWEGATLLYCMNTQHPDQVLSLSLKAVQDSAQEGPAKTVTALFRFAPWSSAPPARSLFKIPSDCGCASQ